ncbi:hypothetical protein DSCW_54270 [Desulfosarcina widdelii]|uniref:Uncharacterized protein n=1 Tax=Desulfosarcina widdelii TaxID=947919 RepID=A0A5K7ZB49_9BACT|nr:hypothetical protein [Desulfosarcina widdelii]BBO78010.1 hypothetical protein DSCW_54270 [Desulfosarcina widdelii]
MKIRKIYTYGLGYLRLARKNRQVKYDAKYQEVLKDFDGDIEWAESIMSLYRDPDFDEGPPLAYETPELKLLRNDEK